MIELETKGFKELEKELESLGGNLHKIELKGLKKGAKQIVKKANENAKRQGFSQKKYFNYLGESKTLKQSTSSAGVKVGTIKGKNLTAPTKNRVKYYKEQGDRFYAIFPEYGTIKQKAKPSLRPAIESEADYTTNCVKESLTKAIDDLNGVIKNG